MLADGNMISCVAEAAAARAGGGGGWGEGGEAAGGKAGGGGGWNDVEVSTNPNLLIVGLGKYNTLLGTNVVTRCTEAHWLRATYAR